MKKSLTFLSLLTLVLLFLVGGLITGCDDPQDNNNNPTATPTPTATPVTDSAVGDNIIFVTTGANLKNEIGTQLTRIFQQLQVSDHQYYPMGGTYVRLGADENSRFAIAAVTGGSNVQDFVTYMQGNVDHDEDRPWNESSAYGVGIEIALEGYLTLATSRMHSGSRADCLQSMAQGMADMQELENEPHDLPLQLYFYGYSSMGRQRCFYPNAFGTWVTSFWDCVEPFSSGDPDEQITLAAFPYPIASGNSQDYDLSKIQMANPGRQVIEDFVGDQVYFTIIQ